MPRSGCYLPTDKSALSSAPLSLSLLPLSQTASHLWPAGHHLWFWAGLTIKVLILPEAWLPGRLRGLGLNVDCSHSEAPLPTLSITIQWLSYSFRDSSFCLCPQVWSVPGRDGKRQGSWRIRVPKKEQRSSGVRPTEMTNCFHFGIPPETLSPIP